MFSILNIFYLIKESIKDRQKLKMFVRSTAILIALLSITHSVHATILNPVGDYILESELQSIDSSNSNLEDARIVVDNKTLTLDRQLQIELASEIAKAQKSLNGLSNFLNRDVPEQIGLVYIHEGYENWSLRFTYGGYLLTTKQPIIVSTKQIFYLKQIFSQTNSLQIAGKNYATTRYMNQLGGILHQ